MIFWIYFVPYKKCGRRIYGYFYSPKKAEYCRSANILKMKSTTAFFKDLDPKFGAVNYRTDICILLSTRWLLLKMQKSTFKKTNNKPPRADLEKRALKI